MAARGTENEMVVRAGPEVVLRAGAGAALDAREVQGDQDREAAAMDASMRMLKPKRTSEDMTM